MNRFLQPAPFGAEASYIHHALSKELQPAPATDCGLGSLEDASRAVLVYLRHAEITGDTTNLAKARALLITVLQLQKPDGLFFDWLDAQGRPVLCGGDDTDHFSYPEVRAMWALAVGVRAFATHEQAFAKKLHVAFWRSFVHVDSCLLHYGKLSEKEGMQFPQWLPLRTAADAASELILAFDALLPSSLNDSSQSQRLEQAMRQFSEGIYRMQAGNTEQFPYGAHLAYESYWWGNCAMQALALAGAKFKQEKWIESAISEAEHFVPYLQEIQFAQRFDVFEAQKNANRINYFPQTPGNMRPLITGLIELSRATGNRRYARRAGEIARWFRGENKAREAVYVEKSGLAKDSIKGNNYVLPDLTAAATVEALLAILEVEADRDSRKEFYIEIENLFEGKP